LANNVFNIINNIANKIVDTVDITFIF
jgi:hypothetical protein